jgi:pimeloyl-ACP methyl ester carboxylesterase
MSDSRDIDASPDANGFGLSVGSGGTSLGDLYFLMDRDPRTSSRPLVIVLHGALRHSENTQAWFPVLSKDFDVIFVDLPGHGHSPSDGEPSIPAFTERFREFLLRHFARRDVVIVGESVGGLVALGVADGRTPCVRGVIAADPPLSTAKQWPIYANFVHRATTRPIGDYLMTLFANAFGYTLQGLIGDRIYYSILAHVTAPALILTGTLPAVSRAPAADHSVPTRRRGQGDDPGDEKPAPVDAHRAGRRASLPRRRVSGSASCGVGFLCGAAAADGAASGVVQIGVSASRRRYGRT